MCPFDSRKMYVVYSGRRPGIYSSWIDCFVQVDRFKGRACDIFNNHGEATTAWEAYSKSCYNARREMIRAANLEQECSARMTTMIGTMRYSSEFVTEYGMEVGSIARWNMQLCLRQACHILRIGDPNYTRQGVKIVEGKTYYRYMASLQTQVIGIPPVSLGRYALDENDAREDVALCLLHRIEAATGMKVVDFNYHNVLWMQDYIHKLEVEIEELIMVNASLVAEMRIMQKK
ncbi:Ribosomal protein L9/RNase H1, N-terminal [Sesbania bispinosa]|nr:Ribosomal protein L9/RNase H1, N-terminal [Sesbania bispinosa]